MDDARDGVPRVGGGGRGQGGREDVLGGPGYGVDEGDYALRRAVGGGARDGPRGAGNYDAVGAVLGDGADYYSARGGGSLVFVLDFHCWRARG
jgi:hypothetical protein